MKSIILSIISLLICINCYAAPGILRHPGGDFDVVVYMGQLPYGPGKAYIYTTKRSIDILLNSTNYNGKDWGLYILIEPTGETRQLFVKSLQERGYSWFNTPSGSRIFWAIQNPLQTKGNMMTIYPQEDIFNDHGELMGAGNADGAETINLADEREVWRNELNKMIVGYLNREFAKRNNMDNGQPIQ